jgi:Ala-tRNA(Pro) deacylase
MLPVIREWYPLHAAVAAGSAPHALFLVLTAAAALALFLRARAGEPVRFEALALAAFLLLAARHVRFTTEASVVATAALCPGLARVEAPRRLRALVLPCALALLALGVAASQRRLGFGFEPGRFPVDAVAWLRQSRLPGPLFNSYNYGGYLIWAHPDEKVFIDGRNVTVYEPALLDELVAVLDEPQRFLALERRYGFRLALLQHRGGGAALFEWLRRRPEWRVVYADERAAILVREDGPSAAKPPHPPTAGRLQPRARAWQNGGAAGGPPSTRAAAAGGRPPAPAPARRHLPARIRSPSRAEERSMAIAPRLKWYLDARQVDYELVPHAHTSSSLETARQAHVPPERLAKPVLLEDELGYVMAIVPASHRIDLRRLGEQLHRELELASEPEFPPLFGDCEPGAIPPVGSPYHVPTVYDDALAELTDVWFEAGDHEDVVHVKGEAFLRLLEGSVHGRFSQPI